MSLHHLHMATSLASLNPSCFQQCFATHQPRKHIVSNQKKQIHVTNLHMSSKKINILWWTPKNLHFSNPFPSYPPCEFPLPPTAPPPAAVETPTPRRAPAPPAAPPARAAAKAAAAAPRCAPRRLQRVARWKWISREKLHRKHHGLDEWIIANLL